MHDASLVFTGFGAAFGRHAITNQTLADLAAARRFRGVATSRVREDKGFAEYRTAHPELTEDVAAFCFFAEGAGFHTRYSAYPYPEAPRPRPITVETAELAARALDQALAQAGLTGYDIDAWVVSTTTVPGAPGVASLVKEYFVKDDHLARTRSIQAGCGAFPVLLEAARELFLSDPSVKHVALAHTDVLTSYLTNQSDFVRHMLFGDGAGAVILSRVEGRADEGLLSVVTAQNPQFLGHLGVNERNEMFHEPAEVKKLAVSGMVETSRQALSRAGADAAQVDWFVPHQTGNGIVLKCARLLGLDVDKVHRDTQWRYGNVSGATVPVGLWLLQQRLQAGQLVLGAAAGVGGDVGAFVYRVPSAREVAPARQRLVGRKVLLTGASGLVGSRVLQELLDEGASVTVVRHRTPVGISGVDELVIDFKDTASLERALEELATRKSKYDALIHCAGGSAPPALALNTPDSELQDCMALNYFAPVALTRRLVKERLLRGMVIYIGSAAEDFQISGSSPYVAAKRALHGWAASTSEELRRHGVASLYVQLGLVQPDAGMGAMLTSAQVEAVCSAWCQEGPLPADEVAHRLVSALWAQKVPGVRDVREGAMTVRRDGYQFEAPLADR